MNNCLFCALLMYCRFASIAHVVPPKKKHLDQVDSLQLPVITVACLPAKFA